MAQQFTALQIAELKEVFNIFDKDGDGHIGTAELREVVHDMDLNLPESETREMIRQIDSDQDDTIDFAEFLQFTAIQFLNLEHSDEVLKEAFAFYDRNNQGYIEVKDLKKMMDIMGEELEMKEVEQILAEADMDRDGVVNYTEFKAILMGR